MKKAVSFILALILVSMLLLPVGAEENASSMLVTKGALTYAIDDNFTIVACDPAVHVKDCTLPGIIDGYKVVRIGKDAFKDCTLLTDIKILEETTDIDEGAFSGCTALTKIFIPSSMVSIGEGAFSRCTNLTDVYYAGTEEQRGGITLGAGNDSFLSATWHYNYDYERPNLPDDMIGKEGLLIYTVNDDGTSCAIRDCEESVSGTYEIPEEIDGYKVTKIKDVAFYECSTLAKLVIPSGVKYIGDSAFDGCTALTEVNIPQNVSYIGPSAFNNCTSLKNITIPDGIQDIDYFSFSGCDSLQSVTLSTSVTEIEDGAFSGCPNLTYVYYAGTEEQKNTIYFGSDNEDILTATWIYESDTPDEQKFTVGRDDFSFLNEEKYFFDKGNIEDAIRISTDAYGDRLDRLYQWFSGIDNIDTRNYFGVDDHEVFSDYSDYEKAYLQIKSGTQISFSSGNARLEYSDGEVKSSNNVSGPYSLRSDGDNDDGEIEFCIEKQQLGKDGFCSVSNDAGGNELTIINDGWSVSIVSDKPIQISMDNTEQSVKIQSEEKGLLSAWLTQNTPSANSAWYGTAVDVNDAKELILTPTSEGVKVNSDNMQDARVTVNGDGTFASKAINTTKNEILVQEDEDATVGDCIKIQGTYTIRASVGLHGTISPAGYVAVDAGGTQTFTFTPDEGYAVEHVKVNGKNKGEITDYTFKKVKKDQEIEVTFREKTEQDSEPKEKRGYGPIIDWILSIIEWIKHWFQA